MNIGHRVLEARRRAGLSQRDLSERTSVPQSTIARIESGIVDPRVSTVVKLLEACGEALEVLPRVGIGVDRSSIRRMLKLSTTERLHHAAAAGRNVAALVEAARGR